MSTTAKPNPTPSLEPQQDLLDILFETRNRAYGAYVLRRNYPTYARNALLIMLSVLVVLFLMPFISKVFKKEERLKQSVEVILEEPPALNPEAPPPPPPPPVETPPPPEVKQVRFVPPILEENVAPEDEEKPPVMDTLQKVKNIGDEDIEGEDVDRPINDTVGSWRAKVQVQAPPPTEDNTIYTTANVQQQAEYPGGQAAMYKWINENIRYPDVAREQGISGKVYVKFVVEKDGSISDIKIVKSPAPSLEKEVIRVLNLMPKWNPAKQNGKAVRVYFNMPVDFKLNN
jgi:protein TonB